MTLARDWAIPVALGLVVAAGLWALPDGEPPAETSVGTSSTSTSWPAATFVLPFPEGRGEAGTNLTFLVLAPQGRAAGEASLNATGFPAMKEGLDWRGDRVAFYASPTVEEGCRDDNGTFVCSDPAWAFVSPWLVPKAIQLPPDDAGPRLGRDGHNATRATIYVFDSRGLLAATNDAKENLTRFAGSPTTLDSALWYIGENGTAPNGTQKPPSFATPLLQKLRPLIEGLPVGGVASTQSNAYVSLYGTLFITARIDELAYAP